MQDSNILLQNMALFGAVSADALHYVSEYAIRRQIPAHDQLFLEGDLSTSMYVILSGRVAVLREWEGKRYKLRELRAGDCVGEMSFLTCSPRSASVEALEDCQVIEITNNLLAELYQVYPEQYTIMVMNMAREVCRRLEQADRRLFALDRLGLPSFDSHQTMNSRSEVLI